MSNKKPIKTRGKIKLGKYFQKFAKGDSVAIVREDAMQPKFPKKFQGRTGLVESRQGKAYSIKIMDAKKEKKLLIEPIHLRKIKN